MKLGLKKSFEIEITDSLVNSFAELSGDFNPLHTNKDYAISNGFGNKVCHGMLLGSFFSQLIGMYLPGKNALYFSQSMNFINPCLVRNNRQHTNTKTDIKYCSNHLILAQTVPPVRRSSPRRSGPCTPRASPCGRPRWRPAKSR